MSKIYGFARCSLSEEKGQDLNRQVRELKAAGAEEIIVAHNHPSGDPTPSRDDYKATVRLNEGAELVGLKLIDHIIVGADDSANGLGFVSMTDFSGIW